MCVCGRGMVILGCGLQCECWGGLDTSKRWWGVWSEEAGGSPGGTSAGKSHMTPSDQPEVPYTTITNKIFIW